MACLTEWKEVPFIKVQSIGEDQMERGIRAESDATF